MKPIRVLFLAGLCSAAATARAETFMLANGGKIEGTLVTTPETPKDKYVIKTSLGGVVTLAKDQVKEVVRRRPIEIEYEKKRHTFPDTVEGQWELAEWCRENHLSDERKIHLQRIIELDTDHAAARRALGYSRFGGNQWRTPEQVMTEQGFVEYKGHWKLPQEVAILEEQRRNELAEKSWLTNLKRWRDWLDGDRREEAIRLVNDISDPLSLKALKLWLEKDEDESVRTLAAEALARIGSGGAIAALETCALEDTSSEVRHTALDLLSATQRPDVVSFFIQKLHDKDNKIVNYAGTALGRMQDPSAIGPLVDALITRHKFQIVTGQPGGMSATFGSGGGGLNMGGGQKIVTQDMQNPSVLDALVSLTKTVNFNYDVPAWKKWLATQRKSKSFDGRRG